MRIATPDFEWQSDRLEHRVDPVAHLAVRAQAMHEERLPEDGLDREVRRQRSVGVLKHHLHLLAEAHQLCFVGVHIRLSADRHFAIIRLPATTSIPGSPSRDANALNIYTSGGYWVDPSLWNVEFNGKFPSPEVGFGSPVTDAIFAKLAASTEFEERKKLGEDLQRAFYEQVAMVNLGYTYRLVAKRGVVGSAVINRP